VTYRRRRARPRRLAPGPALGLTAALAAAVAVAGCTSRPAGPPPASAASTGAGPAPAITLAQARRVWDHYAATSTAPRSPTDELLSTVTGVQRAVLATALTSHSVIIAGTSSGTSGGAYHSTLQIRLGYASRSYGTPVFYLPERAGYPRFFAASATQTVNGTGPGSQPATSIAGTRVPADGIALLVFEQASAGASWLLASTSSLAAGEALPKLATDSAGYIPVVTPAAAALLAQPADVGPLQAAVVDDGPASAAARAVAAGPLTTGLYRGAVSHSGGLTAPPGDVYQWELDGSSYPEFALRTAAGGALVCYAMTLNTTVAVPGYINLADPVRSGAPIRIPAGLLPLLPAGQAAPLVQLSSSQLLSFAAVDPPPGRAKVQVIAIGGGLVSATAS
jgi:hypothetical protein